MLLRASMEAEAYDWVVLLGTMLGAVHEVAMALAADAADHAAAATSQDDSGGLPTPVAPVFPTIPALLPTAPASPPRTRAIRIRTNTTDSVHTTASTPDPPLLPPTPAVAPAAPVAAVAATWRDGWLAQTVAWWLGAATPPAPQAAHPTPDPAVPPPVQRPVADAPPPPPLQAPPHLRVTPVERRGVTRRARFHALIAAMHRCTALAQGLSDGVVYSRTGCARGWRHQSGLHALCPTCGWCRRMAELEKTAIASPPAPRTCTHTRHQVCT
jgi:hypothetical protein